MPKTITGFILHPHECIIIRDKKTGEDLWTYEMPQDIKIRIIELMRRGRKAKAKDGALKQE